uniref:EF1_GNE domain-containing protein n=1 Tax=Rhabditophanes sp. KR3021 TaxID=114890 RepID=A0AC35TKG4_9BILA
MAFGKTTINTTDASDLASFNAYLADFPYVSGYTISAKDVEFFGLFKTAPACSKAYAHLTRWYKNVASFSEAEKKAFGGASTSAGAEEDFDLFDSEEDEEESEAKKKITEERLKAYHEKKAKKAGPIAKSSVILDIKPWDDTTDMGKMEEEVRKITMDGLVWGGGKLIPLAYGIRKLQIIIVIEDDKVSTEDLIDLITTDLEDYVQSVDIHAFNKI